MVIYEQGTREAICLSVQEVLNCWYAEVPPCYTS